MAATWTTCNPINASGTCYLFTTSARTTPVPAGRYYDGTTCWIVGSGGQVTGIDNCIAYNYYTLTGCAGGGSTDYRSINSLSLGGVYSFVAPGGSPVACYEVTSITASPNSNDLPTVYSIIGGCASGDCQQL